MRMTDRSDEQPHEHKDGQAPTTTSAPRDAAVIDVQRLADKVYQLMLADARLARARRES